MHGKVEEEGKRKGLRNKGSLDIDLVRAGQKGPNMMGNQANEESALELQAPEQSAECW